MDDDQTFHVLWTWFEAAAARDDPSAGPALAFSLAEWVHDRVASLPDDTTHRRRRFPMGRDVAVARHVVAAHRRALAVAGDCVQARYTNVHACVSATLMDEFEARARLRDVYVVEDDLHNTDNDMECDQPLAEGDIVELDQVIIPLVLGFETPLTVADAAVVREHLFSGNDSAAQKLAGAFALANTGIPAVTVNTPCTMQTPALRDRLRSAIQLVPSLIRRALVDVADGGDKGLPRGFPSLGLLAKDFV